MLSFIQSAKALLLFSEVTNDVVVEDNLMVCIEGDLKGW